MKQKTRKLIWSAPLVAVLAVAGVLAIFAAQGPGNAQATHEELPGAVQNFTIMPDGHHTIKLSWDAPTGGDAPDGYRIDRSEDNGTWFTREAMHTGTSFTDPGLEAGSTHFYRVFAYNTAGIGPVSEDRSATTMAPTNPGRVRNLTANATGQNSIVLSWQAPEKNGGAPIKHYEIHFAPNPDGTAVGTFPDATVLASTSATDTVLATDGPVLTFSHGNLTAETRYRYIVYAVNDEDLKGAMPSAMRAATTDDLTAPGRPENLTAVHNGDTTVQLYWYAPADNGGTAVTGYDTEVQANCTGGWVDVDTPWTSAAATAHDALWNLDGTDRETSACFRVKAHNSPASVTDDADRRYGGWSSTTRIVLTDETNRALAVPPAVTGPAATYTTDRAKVTWTAADLTALTADRISSYRVDVSEDGISWMSIRRCSATNRADDDGNPFCDYAYDGGEARTYRVFAKVAQMFGPATDPFSSTAETGDVVAPGHVRNLMVRAAGPTQIDVSWTAPENNGGAPIDHYIIQASMMGETAFAAWPTDLDTTTTGNFKSETTSYSHPKLKAGQTWRYRVFAVNKDAAGAFLPVNTAAPANADEAEVDQATTPQETMPRKPEHLSVEMAATSNSVAAGSTGLLLLWNAPQAPAGAAIGGYQVQRMKNDGPWATLTDRPHTNSTFTDYTDTEGLKEGETRAYQVRAVSENGVEGAWSDTAYYPQMGMHNADPMAGADIDDQTVKAGSMVMVESTITDADMDDTLTWEWSSSDTAIAAVMMDATDGSMATITGVAAGDPVTITVKATDPDGAYAMQTFMVTVTPGDLGPATNVMATHDGTEVTITWEGGMNADKFTVVLITRKADGTWDVDNVVYDQNVTVKPHPVNMATRPAGTYIVGVAAGTDDGEWHPEWARGSLEYAP